MKLIKNHLLKRARKQVAKEMAMPSRIAVKNVYECRWMPKGLVDKAEHFVFADTMQIAELKCRKAKNIPDDVHIYVFKVATKGSGIPRSIKRIYR